jgi:hypothetical protein
MKKYIALISLIFIVCIASFGQYTYPRVGATSTDDNTARTLTYKYVVVIEKAGFDSIVPRPNAYQTTYKVSVTNDSIRFSSPVLTNCYFGDIIRIVITGTSGKKVTFAGVTNYLNSKWVTTTTASTGLTTGSIVLGSKGKAEIEFVFDGAVWIESGRVTN